MTEAVLLMAYGTPERLEDVAAYYTHIRRGSPPPPALLDALLERYEAVGGPTALNRITRDQGEALGRVLESRGAANPVYTAFKHVAPFIGDTVERMASDGVTRAVGLVLAPHYSLRSIAEYIAYAEARRPPALSIDVVRTWHDHPGFIAFLAGRLAEAVEQMESDPHIVFTAHSVPAAVLERGDPYAAELRRTCELVARCARLGRWTFAYQSAGRTTEPWLGPDVLDVIGSLAAAGETAVVVQPVGFVADHLEILYDLDVEARRAAEVRGLRFARTVMPNAHPAFITALADIVAPRLEVGNGGRERQLGGDRFP